MVQFAYRLRPSLKIDASAEIRDITIEYKKLRHAITARLRPMKKILIFKLSSVLIYSRSR